MPLDGARPGVAKDGDDRGAWFLTREIELSTSRACLVRVSDGRQASVSWSLPTSKSDLRADGVERTHVCGCRRQSSLDGHVLETAALSSSSCCPTSSMREHLRFLRMAFPDQVEGDSFKPEFPLFPTEEGGVVSKEAMAATIVEAAQFLGVPLESADGSEKISGHTLRVSGAQGLSRLGLDLWAIQLFGRWGPTP